MGDAAALVVRRLKRSGRRRARPQVRNDAFGHAVDLFGPEMTVEDRSTFANNLRINRDQPPTVPKFTDTGHALVPIPDDLFRKLVAARDAAVDAGNLRREGCTRGYLNNCRRAGR